MKTLLFVAMLLCSTVAESDDYNGASRLKIYNHRSGDRGILGPILSPRRGPTVFGSGGFVPSQPPSSRQRSPIVARCRWCNMNQPVGGDDEGRIVFLTHRGRDGKQCPGSLRRP